MRKKRPMSEETKAILREIRASRKTDKMRANRLTECQKQCDDWNAKYPVGTEVIYQVYKPDGPKNEARTTSGAWVLGGHSAVVRLDKASTYHLDFIEVKENHERTEANL